LMVPQFCSALLLSSSPRLNGFKEPSWGLACPGEGRVGGLFLGFSVRFKMKAFRQVDF
jgi:hypothetical protein